MFPLPRSSAWLAALSTRTLVFVVAWVGLVVVPITTAPWQAFPAHPYLDGWARFDTSWYQSIWEYGYSFEPGQQSNVNFFPLYPLLVGLLSRPLEPFMTPLQAFCLAGMVVSQLAFAASLIGVSRLASRLAGPEVAGRTVWLMAAFPFAMFYSAVYTEAVFLCLAVWAFERAAAGRWWSACLLAAGCVLTRVPGMLVAGGLGLEYLRARRGRPDRHLVAFALPLAAAAGLLLYFHLRFGDALVFKTTQIEAWGRVPGIDHLWRGARRVIEPGPWDGRVLTAIYLISIPSFVALSVVACWRLGPGHGAFAGLAFLLAISTGLDGLGRYEAVLFPVFIVAAQLMGRRSFVGVVAVGLLVQLWLAFLFTHWRLVT